ncbi:MAG: BamA/TamA family outer membrane protein [Rikenellaceae bacterium]|nr:BamA/TamA family outer membrane protein [Rikenellaceae bacterium]
MRKSSISKILAFVIIILSASSCSTVKVLPEGATRLKDNKIKITNSTKFHESNLEPYIRQKSNTNFIFAINPFLHLYNWSNGKGKGWDKFVQSIGQAPVCFDSSLVLKSKENIRNHLNYLGYYNSSVDANITTKKRLTVVDYNVTLGKRYLISEIKYNIVDTNIRALVLSDSVNSLIKKGDFISEKALTEESSRIESLVRNNGYYNFSKNYIFAEADTSGNKSETNLLIRIDNYTRNETSKDSREHKKYYIRKVNIYSDYNPTNANYDQSLKDSIFIGGVMVYNISKQKFRPNVIAKLNRLVPGQLYSESLSGKTYDRYVALRNFSGVNLQFDEVKSVDAKERLKDEVDCTIRLTPSKPQGYKINLEASSNSNNLWGISPAVSYYHKNLFRGGEWFTLGLMGNFQFKLNDDTKSTELGVSAGLSIPNFLMIPDRIFKSNLPRTEIGITYNYQSRKEFTRNLISLNYGYNWKMGERFFYRFDPVQLSIIKLFNLSNLFYQSLSDPFLKDAYQNHFDLGAGATVFYTTDASPNPQNTYFYARWINNLSGNILSLFNKTLPLDSTGNRTVWNTRYAQYVRSDFTAVYTLRFKGKTSLATRFNIGLGYAYGNSSSMPFEKLFYAGGANSMRGWQSRSLGPGSSQLDTTFSIPNQTGDFKFEINTEYRFPLFWKIEGALFVDVGNIWNLKAEEGREESLLKKETFFKTLAFNWGGGVRLNLEFVILRLDMGIIAYDPRYSKWYGFNNFLKRNTYSLQFGVGYPF